MCYCTTILNYTMIGLLDQNELLKDNKREIAKLQEHKSSMIAHILNKREENEELMYKIKGTIINNL